MIVDPHILFTQHLLRQRSDRSRRTESRALRLDDVRSVGSRESFRHLAAARISDAHEQHAFFGAGHGLRSRRFRPPREGSVSAHPRATASYAAGHATATWA